MDQRVVCAARMAGFIESEAVFRDRCRDIGLNDVQYQALVAENYKTMGRFAYACSYVPGSPDDKALLELIDKIRPNAPGAEVALYRRLFFESFTMVQADLKLKLERSDEAPARKLAVPERAARYQAQQKRLPGLNLRGELECSDSLIDEAVAQYDDNRLRYIKWEKCLKKRDELEGVKKIEQFTKSADGTLKSSQVDALPSADTSSEYLLQNALTRRGLALDQASLLDYHLHATWIERLLSSRMRPAMEGFARVTMKQLELADKALFERMAELTRDGIVPDGAGLRPLDAAIRTAMVDMEVLQHLTQMQSNKREGNDDKKQEDAKRWKGQSGKGQAKGYYQSNQWHQGWQDKGGNKGGKGKGKKGSGKNAQLPEGLKGYARTPDNSHICFQFNLGKCAEQAKNGCSKGRHVCTQCFMNHPYLGNH